MSPREFEDACFGATLVFRDRSEGTHPVYYALGVTEAGRYPFCVVIQFADGDGYPVSARDMSERDKQRYRTRNQK